MFKGLQIKYVRGSDPVLKLLDDNGNIAEELSILKWNTDSVEEFLSEKLDRIQKQEFKGFVLFCFVFSLQLKGLFTQTTISPVISSYADVFCFMCRFSGVLLVVLTVLTEKERNNHNHIARDYSDMLPWQGFLWPVIEANLLSLVYRTGIWPVAGANLVSWCPGY